MKYMFLFLSLVIVANTRLAMSESPTVVAPPASYSLGKRLDWDGDLASKMVSGIDRFLLRKLEQSPASRDNFWKEITADDAKKKTAKEKLAHLLGLRDERHPPNLELIQGLTENVAESVELARTKNFRVFAVRWKAIGNITGEGILLEPNEQPIKNIVAVPDADQSPEELVHRYAHRLAANKCRVIIPSLISRTIQKRRNSELTNREYLYRSSFILGRQLTGYELQKLLAVVDWFDSLSGRRAAASKGVGVLGWGEGGRMTLYAAALDHRIDAVCISGYFGPRKGVWNEPIDRNVFGLLNQFGDAELLNLALLRGCRVVLDSTPGPVANVRTRGGAPYELLAVSQKQFNDELARVSAKLRQDVVVTTREKGSLPTKTISDKALAQFASLSNIKLDRPSQNIELVTNAAREPRQIAEIEQFNQTLLSRSPYVRKDFFKDHDVTSVDSHANTIESYRKIFRRDVIGEFDDQLLPPNPRTRQVFDEEQWTGHEVVLDVFPDVFAFGILLLPKDLKPGEKRPVVVCQHGLEGRPRNVIENDHGAYHDYAAKLAERGFITFAPQNIYIFEDRFRTLQRKANPLGKTLFSIMVPQHQQIVDWLAKLPQVDPERIAFYGLSYGGKSAMRIPPLVDRYCLSICSADFNDWVWKNASTLSPYSYVWTGEYEIFEWDLGSTFNYAEMAALIAPKPFMVERGHFDGVAPDERVALEFAKVRHLYQAKLGIGDRCEIEFFVGPHTINGKQTFDFLHRHLRWPKADR